MGAQMLCELCHEEVDDLADRSGYQLCADCAWGWDYQSSLTPDERRAEEASVARYVDQADI